jgi:hypothetical protein
MANVALALLTAALVLVTAYYAKQTRETVKEMKAARIEQARPYLIPTIEKLGAGGALPRIINAGTGPALNVKVRMSLLPRGPDVDYANPYLGPGRGQSLLFPSPGGGPSAPYISKVDELTPFQALHLVGECSDTFGKTHPIDVRFSLSEYIAAFKSGMWARSTTVTRTGQKPSEMIAEALINIENLMRMEWESDWGPPHA